jgi:hypothetical protein
MPSQDEDDAAVEVSEPTRFPLPNTFRTVLSRHAGLTERIGYSAIAALAPLAQQDTQLQELAGSYAKYSAWAGEVVVSGARGYHQGLGSGVAIAAPWHVC